APLQAQSPEPTAQSPEPRAQSPEPSAQSPEPRAQSPEPRAQSQNSSPHCLIVASNLFSSVVAGSNLPPRYLARNSSLTALKAILLTGRAKPCPSSGNT